MAQRQAPAPPSTAGAGSSARRVLCSCPAQAAASHPRLQHGTCRKCILIHARRARVPNGTGDAMCRMMQNVLAGRAPAATLQEAQDKQPVLSARFLRLLLAQGAGLTAPSLNSCSGPERKARSAKAILPRALLQPARNCLARAQGQGAAAPRALGTQRQRGWGTKPRALRQRPVQILHLHPVMPTLWHLAARQGPEPISLIPRISAGHRFRGTAPR